jgi:hypothetical protein
VQYNAAVACTDDLVAAVDDCGFDCKLLSVHNLSGGAEEQEERPQVGSSFKCRLPVSRYKHFAFMLLLHQQQHS